MSSSAATKSESAPSQKAPVPDLSWFSCICCARRPIPHASFSMLLTTCSHIVCSSCWNGRGNGECPSCGMKVSTLNLSTTKQLPKQLAPYYKTPADLLKRLLAICEFQEHMKRQTLERRKVAWVLINHKKAKEDFEKEYAECKQLLTALNHKKRELVLAAENLRRRGKDPVQMLRGKVSEEVIKVIAGAPHTPGASAPSTPFLPTPLSRPPSTSTPAVAGTAVETVEPKKLPHTMRGSVTSKAVRRSPSNPPTPLQQPQSIHTPSSVLPAKRLREITPIQRMDVSAGQLRSHTRYSGRPTMQSGQPVRQPYQTVTQMSHPVVGLGRLLNTGRPAIQLKQPIRQPMVQQPHPSVAQFSQPTKYSGQPRIQLDQPVLSGHILQPGQLPNMRPIIPPRRPVQQSLQPQLIQTPSPQQQTPAPAGSRHSGGGLVRIRAVPPSSVSQRIFPSPQPSQISHSSQRTPPQYHTITPSHQHQQSAMSSGRSGGIERAARISLRPTSQSHSHTSMSHSVRGRVKTPTNPSPLLQAFTPRSSSPWRQQQGQGSHRLGSPWKQGHTPSPGTRMSVGSASGGSGRSRLTPMKS